MRRVTWIRGGRVVDPETHRDEVSDILIEGERIAVRHPDAEEAGRTRDVEDPVVDRRKVRRAHQVGHQRQVPAPKDPVHTPLVIPVVARDALDAVLVVPHRLPEMILRKGVGLGVGQVRGEHRPVEGEQVRARMRRHVEGGSL